MAYRKSTLRSMSPTTRKVARLIGEQESVARRFKNLVPEIQKLEMDSRALTTAKQADRFGFSPEEWQDIRNAIDVLLQVEAGKNQISIYQCCLLERLIDKLRKQASRGERIRYHA